MLVLGPGGVLVLWDTCRLYSQTVLNVRLVFGDPEVGGGGDSLWGLILMGAGHDFHDGFPLLDTFYNVHMVANRDCDHRAVLGSGIPQALNKGWPNELLDERTASDLG